MLNLQILDNIIGQVDRHTGNVFVSYHRDDERRQLIIEKVKQYILAAAEKEEDFFREKRGWNHESQMELRSKMMVQIYLKQIVKGF